MARTKAMSTRARELAKELNAEQIRQLAEFLKEEAEKPQLDKKQYNKIKREYKSAYTRLTNTEEALSTLLAQAGKDNSEINAEINDLRHEAERSRLSPDGTPKRRGRPRKIVPEA